MFGMKEVERPAPVLVAALITVSMCVTDATVRSDSCIPQIIESAQGRSANTSETRNGASAADNFAGSKLTRVIEAAN
jgi:hypothetical protein